MDHLILLANIGTDLAKMGQDTAETFGVDWPHLIAQIISFVIVAFFLHRFAYKPVLAVLAERRQRIAEGLANAQRIKAELAKTEAARLEVLEQANLQANKLIEQARALIELKREVGKLVVQTTGKVTGKILTPDDQRRLAEETTRQLAA